MHADYAEMNAYTSRGDQRYRLTDPFKNPFSSVMKVGPHHPCDGSSTVARTCSFTILERTWGGGHPRLICPMIAIELLNKDGRKVWNVLNPTIPDSTTFGNILTFPGHVQKTLLFNKIYAFANNFSSEEVREKCLMPSNSSRRDAS